MTRATHFSDVRLAVRETDLADVIAVASALRPEDVHEFEASGSHDHVGNALRCARLADGLSLTADFDGTPVFIFGVIPTTAFGTYALYGFGTTATRRAFPALTRYGRAKWVPYLFEDVGARRIEVRVPETSHHSIRWLKSCGMRVECSVPFNGATDEPFVQLAITKADYVHLSRQSPASSGDTVPDAHGRENAA